MTLGLLTFAWVWFCLGIVSGAVLGLVFHREDGWGGYGSWRRRLARLGHIAFFGTGVLVLAMALTARALPEVQAVADALRWAGPMAVVGAVTMPLVCGLSAWRKPWRVWFPVPVTALGLSVLGFTAALIRGVLA
ncbi:hypothetical protein [Algisphaera agarilytica]|uniref:Uncharacterized protein n=1 Tax=Algisphaera agarilytica TaxID=1385975 RepID=A0A7X0LL65_9BACT|nr:hypothetical protein [Algisphaera agarilytica]MBB6430306.1 hypothetical protein [Algisphaera agarilytica]